LKQQGKQSVGSRCRCDVRYRWSMVKPADGRGRGLRAGPTEGVSGGAGALFVGRAERRRFFLVGGWGWGHARTYEERVEAQVKSIDGHRREEKIGEARRAAETATMKQRKGCRPGQ
jgi:hypothetical protein